MNPVSFGQRRDLISGELGGVLDHMRWIAALAVCASHLRNILFPDASTVSHLNLFAQTFYFLTLFGTQAVVVFFVISGLLIGGAVLQRVNSGTFSLPSYLIDRAVRLYIVLIPALILTLALYYLGLRGECYADVSVLQLSANLFFLENIVLSPVCNNSPLWSLSNEAFYYIVWPLIILAVSTRNRLAIVATLVAGLIGFISWKDNYTSVAFGALLWIAGVIPWFVKLRIGMTYPAALLAIILAASRLHWITDEYVAALAIAISAALMLSARPPAFLGRHTRQAGATLAGFSYSLYLVHMPLAKAVGVLVGRKLDPNAPLSYVIYALILLAILAVAWTVGQVFERRTQAVRRVLKDYAARLSSAGISYERH